MKHSGLLLGMLLVTGVVASVVAQEKGGSDDTGPYDVVENWLKPLHEGRVQKINGVFAETPDRIYVIAEGEVAARRAPGQPASAPAPEPDPPHRHLIFIVDGNGKLVEEWSQWNQMFVTPHKVEISPYDPEKHVWIIDRDGHQVHKFTHDGKQLVMTLGEKGVPRNDDTHFARPADLAFLPDGTFFVADGYDNARVVKFDKNGKFLMTWGTKGTGPGQFNLVHCVAVDRQRRVYVADRNNNRVQVFDENGKFLDEWRNIRGPSHLTITQDGFLWVTAGPANRILKYDLTGKLLTYWGTYGSFPGGFNDPHQLSVDSDGSLYVADYLNNTLHKFKPKANADRSRLVGQPFK